ncbi:FAD-dependent oxidoreductase [Bosea sp. (in: a-proteobacteria)]
MDSVPIARAPIIIIGAGLAGLSCATRAAALGLDVVVLEAGCETLYPCNSRISGGLFHIAMDDLTAPPEIAVARILASTRGHCDEALAEALARNSRPALEWLRGEGVTFMKAGPDGLRKFSLAPPRVRRTGLHWRGRAGDTMLRVLAAAFVRRGGRLLLGQEAVSLRTEHGRCSGVVVRSGGAEMFLPARAVVLCDGGFQADMELMRRHVSPAPERLLMRNARSGRGSGLSMASAIGADLVGLESFYGHVHHRAAMETSTLWPFPVLDSLCAAGILVDAAGRRFCDEGMGGIFCANAIARLEDPLSAHVIFDDAVWKGPGTNWLLPANPYLVSAGGEITSADTIVELAGAIGLDPAALEATIAGFNADLAAARPQHPPRSTLAYPAMSIGTGRVHAIPVCAGVTYTMGGVRIDASARVLDGTGAPIPGLYAAGATTGGLEGGPFAGYSGGLSKAAIYGFIAANSLAAEETEARAEGTANTGGRE